MNKYAKQRVVESKYTSQNDFANDMVRILSEQLAKNIDREILRSLLDLNRHKMRKKSINKIYKNE